MSLSKTHGQLVIIGGAEDRDGDCRILREFVRCAGGLQARIVVMTAATDRPKEVGDDYIRVFERLGVENIRVVDTFNREDASTSTTLEAIAKATGVFFTGGDQARITSLLKDTETDTALHNRYQEGIVIGGTSAGAAIMPDTMIVEGTSETHPRVEIVEMDQGMGFLPGVVIDQHFAQRGRLGRLLSAIAQQPHLLGLGIDENTAVVVHDNKLDVIGAGAVTITDLRAVSHNNLQQLLKDENLALCDIKLHILPAGYRFNLESRRPVIKVAS